MFILLYIVVVTLKNELTSLSKFYPLQETKKEKFEQKLILTCHSSGGKLKARNPSPDVEKSKIIFQSNGEVIILVCGEDENLIYLREY